MALLVTLWDVEGACRECVALLVTPVPVHMVAASSAQWLFLQALMPGTGFGCQACSVAFPASAHAWQGSACCSLNGKERIGLHS
eukprot:scaffold22861_cov22-Tisochrysis_lutea.AAC.3